MHCSFQPRKGRGTHVLKCRKPTEISGIPSFLLILPHTRALAGKGPFFWSTYMDLKKLDFSYLYLCFAAFWCCTFFVSVIAPPFQAYYTFDETFIADSGVFLWYGITPRILDWPASPSVLIYGLIFGASAFYQVLTHLSEVGGVLDVFVIVDKTAYEYLMNREPYIIAGRAVQMLIVLIVGMWTLRFIFKQKHPMLTDGGKVLIGLVLISSHLIWQNGMVLRPEGISSVFFIHILCRLLFSERLERAEVLLLSILYGLVIAERLIFLIMSPLFFAGIFLLSGKSNWKSLRFSIGVFLLSFLAFCPFVLTDPLIVAKAFFGGIMAKVNDQPMDGMFNWEFIKTYFDNPVSYLILGLTFLGLFRIWKEKNIFYYIVVGNWILFLFLVLRSSKIYDPHVLPAALIHLFVFGIGLITLAQRNLLRWRYAALVCGILVVLGETVMIAKYHTWVRRDINYYRAIEWINEELPANASLATGIDIGLFLAPNDRALDRWIDATENENNQQKKLGYLMGFNSSSAERLTDEKLSLSVAAFAFEDEKLFALQYKLLRKYGDEEKRKRFDFDIFVEDNTLFYHGVLLPEALEGFKAGRYSYWITTEPLEGYQLMKEFSGADGAPVRVYKTPAPDIEM